MQQISVQWDGESISLPTDGWKKSDGDSLTDKEKRTRDREGVVSRDKFTHVKFFVKNEALLIEKTALDKLAKDARKRRNS
jgi:hypothetical protein